MVGISYIKIAVPLLIFVLLGHPAEGFKSAKCKHNELRSQIFKTMECMDKNNNEALDEGLKIYMELTENNTKFNFTKILLGLWDQRKDLCQKLQNFIEEYDTCLNTIVKPCFGIKLNAIKSETYKMFTPNCTVLDTESDPITAIEGVFENLISPRKADAYRKKIMEIMGSKPLEYLEGLITFDKECNWEQKGQVMVENVGTCVMKNIDELKPKFTTTQETNEHFPISRTIPDVFEKCFGENKCFSQREMDLIRDVLKTRYVNIMKIVSKICNELGTCPKLAENLENALEGIDKVNGFDSMIKAALIQAGLAITEFENAYKEAFDNKVFSD